MKTFWIKMVPYYLILIQCACHTCSRRKWKGQTGFLEKAPLAPISEILNLYVSISVYFTSLDLSLFIWREENKRRKKTRDVGNTATKTATLFTLLNTAFTTFTDVTAYITQKAACLHIDMCCFMVWAWLSEEEEKIVDSWVSRFCAPSTDWLWLSQGKLRGYLYYHSKREALI